MQTRAERILRKIPAESLPLENVRYVSVFRGVDASRALRDAGMRSDDIQSAMNKLIEDGVIVCAKRINGVCSPEISMSFDENRSYIWVNDPPARLTFFISLVVLLLVLSLTMFKVWPRRLKLAVGYSSYLLGGFVLFIVAIVILRLLIFAITFVILPPGGWIFPNLFADVGFVESFKPLWGRANRDE